MKDTVNQLNSQNIQQTRESRVNNMWCKVYIVNQTGKNREKVHY